MPFVAFSQHSQMYTNSPFFNTQETTRTMKVEIIEQVGNNMLQLFVHGANTIIYADKSKNIIAIADGNGTTCGQAPMEASEAKLKSLMKDCYTNVINLYSSN